MGCCCDKARKGKKRKPDEEEKGPLTLPYLDDEREDMFQRIEKALATEEEKRLSGIVDRFQGNVIVIGDVRPELTEEEIYWREMEYERIIKDIQIDTSGITFLKMPEGDIERDVNEILERASKGVNFEAMKETCERISKAIDEVQVRGITRDDLVVSL